MYSTKLFSKFVKIANFRMQSTSTNSSLIIDRVGAVTTIGLNRPQKRNCVNRETADLLRKAITDFENDQTSSVGVLYGIGGNFCAGYDLSELAKLEGSDRVAVESLTSVEGPMGPTHKFIKKPLVAAVSGYAVAGGLELALMCDLRVMEETAIMGVYCRRFGVPLIDGGTVRLTAMVGFSRALDMILTGRSVDAKEAFEWGLANRLVAHGTSLGQAINLAMSLVKFPQECLLADRKSVYNAAFAASYDKLLKFERENSAHIIAKESIEGAKKFMSGIGKHGKSYNLTKKPISDWEAEENEKESKSKL